MALFFASTVSTKVSQLKSLGFVVGALAIDVSEAGAAGFGVASGVTLGVGILDGAGVGAGAVGRAAIGVATSVVRATSSLASAKGLLTVVRPSSSFR